MKKVSTLLFFLGITLAAAAQGIEFFQGTWEEALAAAQKSEKLIFVDGYAEWCGPCKRMAKNVFTDSEVGAFYNKHFINVKMDMEKGEGPRFGQKYPVTAYPTLLYIDFTGEVVLQVKGARQADAFIELGQQALGKIDRTSLYEEAYENGDRDPTLVYNYIKALNQAGKPSLKVSNEYLRTQTDLTTKENLRIIHEAAVEADSRLFGLLIEHRKAVGALLGEAAVEDRIALACRNTLHKAIEFQSQDLLEEAKSKMKDNLPREATGFAYEADMAYARAQNDLAAYLKACKGYSKKVIRDQPDKLHALANELTKNFRTDENCMKEAERIAGEAAEKGELYNYYFTYARILNYNGKKEEALAAATKSLEMARETGSGAERMVEELIQAIKG